MKRTLMTIALLLCAVFCFAACGKENENGNGTDPGSEPDAYEALGRMLEYPYTSIAVTVEETLGGETLGSEYTLTYREEGTVVSYSVERFGKLSLDGTPAASEKVTGSGKVLVRETGVELLGGEDIGLTADTFKGGLTFRKEYFKDPDLTSMYLRSDVADPDAFFGRAGYTDMHVNATFLDFFYEIDLTCKTPAGGDAAISLTFTV